MLARVENGVVIEQRNIAAEDIPEHKRSLWRPVVYEGSGPVESVSVEADCVRIVLSYGPTNEYKASLLRRVDADAETCRLRYITPGAGMMLTYQEKFAQATAAHAMGEVAANAMTAEQRAAAFPLLDASVGIEAATLWDVSNLVLQRYAAFAQLARVIEQKRLAGKKAISDASDAAAARAAYEAISWTIS